MHADQITLQVYYDLFRNDFGHRPHGAITPAQARAWIDARPNRACGYGDPDAYADDLEWSARMESDYMASMAQAAEPEDFLDYDARGRRVILFPMA